MPRKIHLLNSHTHCRYDIETDTWTELPTMDVKRHCHESVALSNKIYAIGGKDNTYNALHSVECYDIAEDKWLPAAPLNAPRARFGCCVIRNRIYVIGGYSDLPMDTIERYDERINRWSMVILSAIYMNIGMVDMLCSFSFCILSHCR